jgi:hypothetical protein
VKFLVKRTRDMAKHWVVLGDWDSGNGYVGRHKPNHDGTYTIKTDGKLGRYLPQRKGLLRTEQGPLSLMNPVTGWTFVGQGREHVDGDTKLQWASYWNPFTYMHAHETNDAQDSMNANVEQSWLALHAPTLAVVFTIGFVLVIGLLGFVATKVGG